MAKRLYFLILLLYSGFAAAQSDSIPSMGDRIAYARQQLLVAFLADDPAEASLWRDSLMQFEDSSRVGLVWDERWLLYYWEGTYGNLFDEAVRMDEATRQQLADKIPPPSDSLFKCLDRTLFEKRFALYESIGRGFLSEEEKQFALIELDYLLRLNQQERNSGEWNNRLRAFLNRYPESRFTQYIKANLLDESTPTSYKVLKDRGFTFDALFLSGRWRNTLETTLQSPYGFDIGFAYWRNPWNFSLRCIFGWEKLSRSVYQDGFEWPEDELSVLIVPSLELGYDLINNKKFRLFPAAGAGISILKPPGTDEESDNPLPDYYSNFFFAKGFLGCSLNADIKWKYFSNDDPDNNSELSYVGIRMRVGYNWLNWGHENPDLRGDMFFFAVGINLFGQAFH